MNRSRASRQVSGGLSDTGRSPTAKAVEQGLAGPRGGHLDGAQPDVEGLGDLVVGKAAVVEQAEDGAGALGQAPEAPAEGGEPRVLFGLRSLGAPGLFGDGFRKAQVSRGSFALPCRVGADVAGDAQD